MYVKLVHPCDQDKSLFFDVGGEFWPHIENYFLSELESVYPDGAIREKRSMVHWPGGRDAPQATHMKALMFQVGDEDVYTNWTTYLLNNEGKTIERVFP